MFTNLAIVNGGPHCIVSIVNAGWWCNNHLEKYVFVNGWRIIPYMKWKIKFMLETTNQIWIEWEYHGIPQLVYYRQLVYLSV